MTRVLVPSVVLLVPCRKIFHGTTPEITVIVRGIKRRENFSQVVLLSFISFDGVLEHIPVACNCREF